MFNNNTQAYKAQKLGNKLNFRWFPVRLKIVGHIAHFIYRNW